MPLVTASMPLKELNYQPAMASKTQKEYLGLRLGALHRGFWGRARVAASKTCPQNRNSPPKPVSSPISLPPASLAKLFLSTIPLPLAQTLRPAPHLAPMAQTTHRPGTRFSLDLRGTQRALDSAVDLIEHPVPRIRAGPDQCNCFLRDTAVWRLPGTRSVGPQKFPEALFRILV